MNVSPGKMVTINARDVLIVLFYLIPTTSKRHSVKILTCNNSTMKYFLFIFKIVTLEFEYFEGYLTEKSLYLEHRFFYCDIKISLPQIGDLTSLKRNKRKTHLNQ